MCWVKRYVVTLEFGAETLHHQMEDKVRMQKNDTNLFSTNSSHSFSKTIHKDGKFVGLED